MEIKKSAIVVKLDKEEKETLEKAFRIVAEIQQNKLIQESCGVNNCPFSRYCNLANQDAPGDCLLDTTMFNLKEIMNYV